MCIIWLCMCIIYIIIYIYTYLHLSLYTYDSDLWFMPCCCPYMPFRLEPQRFPPGLELGARFFSITMIFSFYEWKTFWKFTLNIYIWLHISYIYQIYIYIIYICISYIYIYVYIRYIYIYIRYIYISDIYIYISWYIHMLNHSELPFLQGWLGNSHGKSVLRWETHRIIQPCLAAKGDLEMVKTTTAPSVPSLGRWQGMGRNFALQIGYPLVN